MKLFISLVSAGLFLLSGVTAFGLNEYIFEPEEYLIYSTVIDSWCGQDKTKEVFIRDHTAIYQSGPPIETELAYVRNNMVFADEIMINDFKAKNIRAYNLDPFFNQRGKYKIISQKEINSIFDHNPYWDKYYRRNPDSEGIITFSRVGFNRARDKALLHVANQWNRATGAGVYILLSRQKDNSWKIESELRGWYSWNND